MIVGRKIIWLVETTSTMDEIERLADRGEAEGVVVVADFQSRGKGRAGREWVAPPGSALLCSILLRPKIPANLVSSLPLHIGVCVAEAIEELTEKTTKIKWPNDILMSDKKVAGILMTSRLTAQEVDNVIVGLGVNVTGDPYGVPAISTTLARESNKSVDRRQLLDVLLPKLDNVYRELVAAEGALDLQGWSKRAAFLNERIFIADAGERLEGTFTGIDCSGALLLELDDGSMRKVISGDFTRGPRRTEENS